MRPEARSWKPKLFCRPWGGQVSHAVIDTWEDEPVFNVPLLDAADIGTPHIAGHSFEGKVCGTVMVYREACRFLGLPATWSPEGILPEPIVPKVSVDAWNRRDELVLREVVKRVYDIERDDADLRAGRNGGEEARRAHFDRLRRNYPIRREFRFTRVKVSMVHPHWSKFSNRFQTENEYGLRPVDHRPEIAFRTENP
jgi:erythronate-4-phosphate dehydrogenase